MMFFHRMFLATAAVATFAASASFAFLAAVFETYL